MAYDKLVDSAQLDSDLGDIADAIRAKSGGSSSLAFPAGFVSEIGTISGGGGSLPSVISKIDGGSFTLASDTKCSAYSIATTLNVPAKYFLIWTDDLNSFGAISNRGLILATVNIRQFESASGTMRYGLYSYLQRQAAGGSYQGATTMTYANNPETFTDNNMIRYYVGDTFYIAGATYKWLAWV